MKWLTVSVLLLTPATDSCHQATPPPTSDARPTSTRPVLVPPFVARLDTTLFNAPLSLGLIKDPDLSEVSGVASSVRNPGYLWTEEDSGNPSQIQLITTAGVVVGRFTLPSLTNTDWEDIAVGPGPSAGQTYVYLAEIGDNAAGPLDQFLHRLFHWTARKMIYRFAEPALTDRPRPVTDSINTVETINLTLPEGPRNAEAILVDPVTNDLYLLTKGWDCAVYRAAYPQSLTAPIAMQHMLTLPLRKVTSAAVSPDGTEILIRTYKQLYYYKCRTGESVVSALQRPPLCLPVAEEAQGEAIGWRADGGGFFSLSERGQNGAEPVYFYQRK